MPPVVSRPHRDSVTIPGRVADDLARDGVVVLRDLLAPNLRADLAAWWQTIKPKIDAGVISRSAVHTAVRLGPTGSSVPEDRLFNELHLYPPFLALARAVLGNDVCHLMSRLLVKDVAVAGPVECHQDWPYFIGGTRKLAVMLAVTPNTTANGKLVYLKGSHHFGPLPCGDIDYRSHPELERVAPDLEVGDVLAHDWLTWHYSDRSDSGADRAVIQLVYQPSSDPTSTRLVSGQLLTDASCAHPIDLMSRVDPSALFPLPSSRAAGIEADPHTRDTVRKVALGLLGHEDDAVAMAGHLALLELSVADGNVHDARIHLEASERRSRALQCRLDDVRQRIQASERVVTEAALDAVHGLHGTLALGSEGLRLTTAPEQWAYAAQATLALPPDVAGLHVRIEADVESGTLGVGWLTEDGRAWVVRRGLERSHGTSFDLVLPEGCPAGMLVFDNWTPGGVPAQATLRRIVLLGLAPQPAS